MPQDSGNPNRLTAGDWSMFVSDQQSVSLTRLPVEPLASERHRLAMEIWNQRRGNRIAPARRDLEPWDLKTILPFVILVDVMTDPLDFQYRLVGTQVRDIHGIELTGSSVRTLEPRPYFEQVWGHFCELLESKQPQLCRIDYTNRHDLPRSFTVLRLPLSNDGETINMILAVHEPHGLDA
jgi:hypothetical protein